MNAVVFAGIVACALPAFAQIDATARVKPDGRLDLRLRNDSRLALSAFAVTVNHRDAAGAIHPFSLYEDSAVDPAFVELPAGQERSLGRDIVWGTRWRYEPPIVTAAIFADGSATGDGLLLNRLLTRRRCLLQAVETSIEMLESAGKRNVPRAQLISQFRMMDDSLNHWYLPREQQTGRSLYQRVMERLEALPDAPFGSPFPPTTFVEEQTAELHRQRVLLMDAQPSLADAH